MKNHNDIRSRRRINRVRKNRRKVGNILFYGAFIIGMLAFFYMFGTIGHSDYCVKFHIEDDWSMMKYIVHCSLSMLVIIISAKVGQLGEYMRSR